VGCAHQKALNLTGEGGHTPPYDKNFRPYRLFINCDQFNLEDHQIFLLTI